MSTTKAVPNAKKKPKPDASKTSSGTKGSKHLKTKATNEEYRSSSEYTQEVEDLKKGNITEGDMKALIKLKEGLKAKHRKPVDALRKAEWSVDYYKKEGSDCYVVVRCTINNVTETKNIKEGDSFAEAAKLLLGEL